MYLTRAEKAAVSERSQYPGDPEELVRQALEAVVNGQASEEAYSVTEVAGIVWATPHIWMKEYEEVDADKARAILAEAKTQGIYEGPIPEDDKKAISEADDLVEMAQQAWDQYVRGPEVESLLRIAREEFDGSGESQDEADPEPEGSSEETKEEEKPPVQNSQGDEEESSDEDLSKVEPWEGYDKEKVQDIVDGIDAAVKDYAEEDLTELMSNIWAYEAAHKARKAVLAHLETVAASLGGDDEPEEPKQEAPPEHDDEVEKIPEDEPEPEKQPEPDAESEEPKQEEKKPEPKKEKKPPPEKKEELKQDVPQEDLSEDADEHQKLVDVIEKEIENERLHVPQPPAEDLPELPDDYTKITDKELQQLFMTFSAAAYYKGYLLERDERLAFYYRGWADELHNELLKAAEKYDENGKQKTMTLLEAEISDDENVKKLRRRQRKHDTFASAHRRERDSMNKLCEAFSRLETMRQNEWERSGKQQRRS